MSEQPETESLSIEDRLVAQFGDEQPAVEQPTEQPEAEAAPESEAQPEFVEHEYEGKVYQVPPELKEALLRQSDYTRKTTEVAERQRALEQKELQVKAFEAEKQFRDSAQEDIVQMQEIDFQIKQWKSVDVTGMTSEQMWQLKMKVDDLKEQREKLSHGINAKWQNFQNERNKLVAEAKAKAEEHVSKSIKGWGSEAKQAIRDYATSKGFTSAELEGLGDPRVVEVLWEAAQFRKLQSQAIQGKVKAVPTVKPGSSNPMPQNVKDQFALKKTLSNKSLSSAQKARAIERELMNRF
jgi:hypothetical protein